MIQSAGKFQGHWQRVPRDWASGTRRVPFAGKGLLVRGGRSGRRAGRGRSRRRPGRAGDGGRRAAGCGGAGEPGPRACRHPQLRRSLPGRPGDGQPGAGRPQESRTDLRPADRPRHPPRQQPGRSLAAARRGTGGRRALAGRCGAPHAGHHLHGLHCRRQRHAAGVRAGRRRDRGGAGRRRRDHPGADAGRPGEPPQRRGPDRAPLRRLHPARVALSGGRFLRGEGAGARQTRSGDRGLRRPQRAC